MNQNEVHGFQKYLTPKWGLLLLSLIYFSLQIPFIKADPDIQISWSRGANTDEGLHASQIRNLINHGNLGLQESDNFIKTPLFGAFLFTPIALFGSSLSVARWAVIIPFFLLVFWVSWKNQYQIKLLLFFIPMVFLEYHIFTFSHFSLSEIPSTIFIFSAILLFAQPLKKDKIKTRAIGIALLFSLAYLFKIQFLYIIPILPILLLVYFLKKRDRNNIHVKTMFWSSLFMVLIFLIYILAWYLPNQEFYNYVMTNQTTNRFAYYSDLPDHLRWINSNILLEKKLKPVTICFYFLFPVGVFLFFRKVSTFYKKIFFGLSIWLLLESHKLTMMYLPTRYLISLIFCLAAINSLVVFEIFRLLLLDKKYYKWIFIPGLIYTIAIIFNLINYQNSFERRTFEIRKINQYLGKFEYENRPIIGAWAPSLTWKTKAKTYPIWGEYFNDKNILTKQKPAIIISELDESDSSQAYQAQEIQIDEYADSIRYFQIHNFKLKILWMKND
ncbi:MAG: hypothetical protein P8M17_04005 [Saprospiraceae bacterium]|nr:hypothetical protein [Saprospiraceae bacterium]MDG2418135.1 hypothetical protein [Saprospiraceae bacterium]